MAATGMSRADGIFGSYREDSIDDALAARGGYSATDPAGHRRTPAPGPDGTRHPRLDAAPGPRLLALGCELVWATTWMAQANEEIAPRRGRRCCRSSRGRRRPTTHPVGLRRVRRAGRELERAGDEATPGEPCGPG